jgi:hypothetical protein
MVMRRDAYSFVLYLNASIKILNVSVHVERLPNVEAQLKVRITANEKGTPPGRLAEVELHFDDGPLEGLKLIGFSIWERRTGTGRNVTFPARSYAVNGERRSFALLRPIVDVAAQERIRQIILDAYAEYEEAAAQAS